MLNDVLQNHKSMALIIGKKKNDGITSQQMFTTIHQAQYLRLTWRNVLEMNSEEMCKYKDYCEITIENFPKG